MQRCWEDSVDGEKITGCMGTASLLCLDAFYEEH